MRLSALFSLAIFLFAASEMAMAFLRRAPRTASTARDRGSMWTLWAAIFLGVAAAIWCQFLRVGRMPWPASLLDPIGLLMLAGGLALRWAAILSLGRYFTVNVAIARDHRIVESGLYRYVRHPSYSGLLLAFFGMGLSFHSWISLAALLLPICAALARRIAVEEEALRAAFPAEYEAYAARTWKLVPWVY
jgi:protein-S-isoprenylcysteine O-methyltransferase